MRIMETQVKEECEEVSICTSGDLASLTLIEKYDRFLLVGEDLDETDADSDGDFFSNDTIREEYALMKRNAAKYVRSGEPNRLSSRLQKFKNSLDNEGSIDVCGDSNKNGNLSDTNEKANSPITSSSNENPDIISFDKLIEQLNSVKKSETDWRTISYTEEELEKISHIHAQILNFINTKSAKSFERPTSTKDLDDPQNLDVEVEESIGDDGEQSRDVGVDDDDDDDEDVEVNVNDTVVIESSKQVNGQENEHKRMLDEKVKSLSSVRDRFYEVEQQVREYIEQLELVERYKMESVD